MLEAKLREERDEAGYITGELFVLDTAAEESAARARVSRGISEAAKLAFEMGLTSPVRRDHEDAVARICALTAALE